MKKTTILFCFVLFFYLSFAQEAKVGSGMEKYKEFLSPQAGSMLRFDRVEPISNDGAPIVKVQLYSCDDPDFTLHTDFYGQDGFLAHVKNPTFDDAQTRSQLLESPLSNTTNNVLGEALGDLTRVHADDRTPR